MHFSKKLKYHFLGVGPKKSGGGPGGRGAEAKDLKDFRPISLVGGLYQLLAKVVRLKKVGEVILESQHIFIKERDS